MRRWPVILGVVAAPLLLSRFRAAPDPLPSFPKLILWAWESPQDLRFVKPGLAGIAFLSRTVRFDDHRVRSQPRVTPLRFTPGTDLIAVVRLESLGPSPPPRADVVRETMQATKTPGVRALQIDFDARQSELDWYAGFLRDLHSELPSAIPLTITALENWCEHERWIDALPIADATPMLFRMGPDDRPLPRSFPAAVCRSSAGVSTDELPVRIPPARRLYIFHPGPWTPEAYDAAVAQSWRWWR